MHLRIPFPLRAPDGAAAGADPGGQAGAGAQGAAPPAGGVPGGIFDAVGDDPPAGAGADPAGGLGTGADGAARPQRPDTIPEQFWDAEKGAPHIDDLAKSWRDLRAQISRGEHKPPEKPEAYSVPKLDGVPEGLIGGEGDTLWPEIRKAAHGAGITQKQLDALAAPFLQALAEDPANAPITPEARKAAMEAELARLGPNGRQVVRDTKAWIAGLHARGELTDAERDVAYAIGTAEGVRLLAKLRAKSGEAPIPTEAFGGDDMAQADAERLMQEGFRDHDEAKLERARRKLQELEKAGRLVAPR
jgi:hypothetical protein